MMKRTKQIMGMPVIVMCDSAGGGQAVFDFFREVDVKYSPFIATSDVSRINRGELQPENYDPELREILSLAEDTKQQSDGFFDVWYKNTFDPSGIVKGWAIQRAAILLEKYSDDFYIEAGGDIQLHGQSPSGQSWRIGIRNPFNRDENISIVELNTGAVATSGTAIRGQHIYNPHQDGPIKDIVSITVTGPRIVDADRYATAAFAMGSSGIHFIASIPEYEAYMVNAEGIATMTPGWQSNDN